MPHVTQTQNRSRVHTPYPVDAYPIDYPPPTAIDARFTPGPKIAEPTALSDQTAPTSRITAHGCGQPPGEECTSFCAVARSEQI